MGRQKYKTEEERKAARKEYLKQYGKQRYQENREKALERQKQWYQGNKEKILDYQKEYYQENKKKRLVYQKQYNKDNAEKITEYNNQYMKQYRKTPIGRALSLSNAYNRADKKHNRGECTLTAQWIIDHIFSQKCIYCGEDDWRKLGCDRKDNSLPHTEDNVVPCCVSCNTKRGTKSFEEFLNEIR